MAKMGNPKNKTEYLLIVAQNNVIETDIYIYIYIYKIIKIQQKSIVGYAETETKPLITRYTNATN